VMLAMQHLRKLPSMIDNPLMFCQFNRIVALIMNYMFTIAGKPIQPVRKMRMGHARHIGLIILLKDGFKGATAL
ncbi:FAD-dependent oxidoreductase, partial [Escherichia coli]